MRLFKNVNKAIPGAIGRGLGVLMLMAREILATGNSTSAAGEGLELESFSVKPWQAWMMCAVVTTAVVCVYRYRAPVLVQQDEVDDLELRRSFVV
jgi:hypothetical protein